MQGASTAPAAPIGKGTLLRVLGVGFGLAVTVGGTIGVGILRTPGTVAGLLAHPWLILLVWLAGGLYALLGTNAVVELATTSPEAGGWYVYSRRAFGDFAGFTIGWSDWLAQCVTIAILAIAVGEFSASLFPGLAGDEHLIALLTLLVFAAVQWAGVRSGSRTQEFTSAVKALGLLAFVAACFVEGGREPGEAGAAVTSPAAGSLFAAVVLSLQQVIYTYDGWYCAIYFTEEDRAPGKNLPRSAFGGVLATLAIYLLVNAALLYALPLAGLAQSAFPASDVATALFGQSGGKAITLLAAVSQFSIINATLMMATRVIYGLGRDGLFASFAARVHSAGTPRAAMLLSTAAAAVLVVTGTFNGLIAVASCLFILVDGSGFLALLVLRKRCPEEPRPYRAVGYPASVLLLLVVCVLFLLANVLGDPRTALYTTGLVVLCYPAYRLGRKRNPQPGPGRAGEGSSG